MNKNTTTELLILVSTILVVIVSITLVVGMDYTPSAYAQQPRSTSITPSAVNFTKLFAEKLTKPPIPIDPLTIPVKVIYQSNTLVVLRGNAILTSTPPISITHTVLPTSFNNDYLWSAVDLVKQQGYSITSVLSFGLNTDDNPIIFYVTLQKK
jgi:hypothetical protein